MGSRDPSRGTTVEARCALLALGFTLSLWLALWLGLPAVAPAQAPDPRAERAAVLVEAGRLEAAEDLLLAWLGDSPASIEPYLGLLEVWAATGAVERVPRLILPAAERWLENGREAAAHELLVEAVEVVPDCSPCWGLLGRIRIERRAYRQAEAALERALALAEADGYAGQRPDPTLTVLLGLVLWENGDATRAEAVLTGVDPSAPSGRLARQHLARLWLWQGRYEEAAATLEAIVARRPDRVDLRLDLARALEGSGRLVEARREFERVVAALPDDPGALYGLARVLDRLGEGERARETMARFGELRRLEREALIAEGRREATLAEGRRLMRSGEPRAAAELLARLPPEGEAPALHARALLASGDEGAARRVLREALARDPARLDLRALLAEIGEPESEGEDG